MNIGRKEELRDYSDFKIGLHRFEISRLFLKSREGGVVMHFEERTIKVIIDEDKCAGCTTHACVAGCKLYDRGILVLKDGKPALGGDTEYAKRVGTECLACEYECWFRGNKAITIEAPIPGLEEYKRKHGVL